jgi:hypothetical protein
VTLGDFHLFHPVLPSTKQPSDVQGKTARFSNHVFICEKYFGSLYTHECKTLGKWLILMHLQSQTYRKPQTNSSNDLANR